VLLKSLDYRFEARRMGWCGHQQRAIQFSARKRVNYGLRPDRCEMLRNQVGDLATKPLHRGLVEVER
jgi:hypothetical protein